jgi:hypothetical protein
MTELRSLGCYACIDKCVQSKGKRGNKSTGRAATRLKAKKCAKLMDVARGRGKARSEMRKMRKCENAEKCNAMDKGSMNI